MGDQMSLRVILSAVAILVLISVLRVINDGDAADLVLTNGHIVTVDDDNPTAQAIAIRDGEILAVGNNSEINEFIGSQTEIIDLEGQTAIPGFIEGHAHFTGVGRAQLQLNLMNVANWDEIVGMVEVAVTNAEPGELILGRGWHQEKWDRPPVPNVEGIPLHITLSAASPNNPVLLTHASGHAVYANAKAMELSGVDNTTQDPTGGEIIRDGLGNPIGYFRETAS